MEKTPTGSNVFDKLLNGGYELETLTTVYGPSGSGKSNLCHVSAVNTILNENKKVIYVDTEGGFSLERLKQITPRYDEILEKIVILKPTNFEEQKKAFLKLNKLLTNEDVGLIIVDTISMLYRLELGKTEETYSINRELGIQIALITEICRKKKIPILVTTQVYANFEEQNQVKIVGGDILKYASKCLVELKVLKHGRMAILRKHRSIKEGREALFKIEDSGLIEII
ncbi:DNA repair and recombination protein RadB [Candidatus Woesearchaeota archaeon]|jgi:DNA repair protein RadB|nr:DNA repair and recombination protein RadB [Candidatus Woesearchaeota archaeon]